MFKGGVEGKGVCMALLQKLLYKQRRNDICTALGLEYLLWKIDWM